MLVFWTARLHQGPPVKIFLMQIPGPSTPEILIHQVGGGGVGWISGNSDVVWGTISLV